MGVYLYPNNTETEITNAYIGIPFPESIVLDKSSISLTTIGQTEQLTATIEPTVSDKTITWSSDDTTVATVSTTGLVTCVTPGDCTITATTVNGLTASCSVDDQQGWQPGVNTIAYYKFEGNLNDSSGGSHNLSVATGSITYGTASGGGKYAHINNNTRTNYWERSFDYNGNNTISLRMNPQITNGSILLEMWSSRNEFLRFSGAIVCGFGGDMTYSMSANTRYLVTFTRSGTSTALYINGSLIGTGTGLRTGTHNIRFKLNNAGDTSSSTYSNNAYLSELIWESKARTAQEITDYYNSTKSNYGL